MKTFDGYKKRALTDEYALLAGGGHKPLSDFSTSGHTHSVKINGTTKTIAASGGAAVDLGSYLSSILVSAALDNITWALTAADTYKRAFIYNTYSTEYSYLFGLNNNGRHGTILKMGYADRYLRILRKSNGNWHSTDWEKISAGYADSAGAVAWANVTGKPSTFTPSSHTHPYLPLTGGTLSGGINFSNTSHLLWNSGSYYLRIFLTDDATADTAVFTFLQSTDSGTNWSNLMTIRDNGKVIANTFIGALSGNASSATKLTSSAGSTTLPVYFSSGKPIACTASSVFSNLSNSGNNISVTVAGQNRTLTVGYASSAEAANYLKGYTKIITVNGDINTYYPVKIPNTSRKSLINTISVWRNLGELKSAIYPGSHGSYTTGNGGGVSCWYEFVGRYNGWDGNGGYYYTRRAWYAYDIQLSHAAAPGNAVGDLFVWLRGGGTEYYVSTNYPFSDPVVYYERTNVSGSSQYPSWVEPRTDIGNKGIINNTYYGNIIGNANTASGLSVTHYWANVAISTSSKTNTTPQFGKVTISGAYPQIQLNSTNSESSIYYLSSDGTGWATGPRAWGVNGFGIGVYTPNNGVKLTILDNGNVGIGTSSPSYKLHVAGATAASGFIKSGSSDSYVLLGGGGHKTISDFAASGHTHDNRYLRWSNSSADTNAMGWGTLTTSNGYNILSHASSSDGGDMGWVYKNGQIFYQIDGFFYQNEGRYRVLDTSDKAGLFTSFINAGSLTTSISIGGTTKTLKIDADTIDGYHASSFAFQGAHNNLTASGNEFTFASSGFSGTIWLNYRTAGGANGNITEYRLGNGAGSSLGSIIHTGNYNNYSPTKTGGGASGTWGINISGNAATSNWLNPNNTLTYGASGLNYFNILGTAGNTKANNTPRADWYHIIRMNHGNSAGYLADIAVPLNDVQGIWWRQIRTGNFYGWYRILDSNNYTEFTVTKTGGGASGTWGISITGNAVTATNIDWGGVTNKPSSFTPSSHNHSFTLGVTTITTGGTYNAITGPFAVHTDASADKAFSIRRSSASEGVNHWVDDVAYHIEYTNDEASSSIAIRLINTDTERAANKGANAKDVTVYLDCYRNFYPNVNNSGSIGLSGYKWANMYATTFHGSLDGTATKLETVRTIWGQSFDGSEDVRGKLTEVTDIEATGVIYSNKYNSSGNKSVAAFIFNKGGDFFGIGPSSSSVLNIGFGTTTGLNGTWKNELMTITNTGNVGIGTTNPAQKLYVNGLTYSVNGFAVANGRLVNNTSSGNGFIMQNGNGTNLAEYSYYHDHAYVCNYYGSTENVGIEMFDNGNFSIFTKGSGKIFYALNNGNVGIGTTSPSYKLYVVGDIYTTTGFKKEGSSDSYVLLGGGSHKLVSDFSMAHSHPYSKLTTYSLSAGSSVVVTNSEPGIAFSRRKNGGASKVWTFTGYGDTYVRNNITVIDSNDGNIGLYHYNNFGFVIQNTASNPALITIISYSTPIFTAYNSSTHGALSSSAVKAVSYVGHTHTTAQITDFPTSLPANGGTSSAVTINYNNDSNSTYQMLWGSGNYVYGTGGIYCNPSSDYLYAASMVTSDWFRSTGNTGWYNNSYGGGIYMEDTTYVRTYNSKAFYVSNSGQHAIYTAGGFASAKSSGSVFSTYYNGTWYGDTLYTHGNGNLSVDAPGGSLYLSYNRGNTYFGGGTYYINRSGYFNGSCSYAGNADKLDGYHFSDLESRYVNVSGDSMSGILNIQTQALTKSSPTLQQLVINGPSYNASNTLTLQSYPGIGFHMPSLTLASLIFNGKFTGVNGDFSGYVPFYGSGFIKHGSSDSYVLLGGGGHKAIGDFATSSHTHLVKINGTVKTISAPGGYVVDLGTYLTSHQSVTNKAATLAWGTSSTIATIGSTNITLTMPANPNSDTKNTAGSTNTSSKIFLIGATSQAANPLTYSHDTAYVDTDGCLYSGSAKVLTAHLTIHSLTIQGNGTTLGTYTPNSAAKTINITPTNIGAAAASHTHRYLPLAGGTMDNNARISHNGNLYIGRSDNSGWVLCLDMCSLSSTGDTYWSLRASGTLKVKFVYLDIIYPKTSAVKILGLMAVGDNSFSAKTGYWLSSQSIYVGNENKTEFFDLSGDGIHVIHPLPHIDFYKGKSSVDGNYTLRLIENTEGRLTLDSATTTPSLLLAGNIYASGYYESSDITLKTNFSKISTTIEQISDLPVFDFSWKENLSSRNTGTSAQAVQTILPNIVTESSGSLKLNYGVLGTVAGIIACKELVIQKSEIEQLRERVIELEKQLNEYRGIRNSLGN